MNPLVQSASEIIDSHITAQPRLVLFVVGPTASGKSSLGVELAQKYNGEVISLDSRQIYQGMDIGTGTVTDEEMSGVPHHLISVVSPTEVLTLVDIVSRALVVIQDCFDRGVLPVCVGGTGLYVDALCRGYDDFIKADLTDSADLSELRVQRASVGEFATLELGIRMDRERLYDRINERTGAMFDQGLMDEVQALLDAGVDTALPALTGIGYKLPVQYLEGKISLEECITNTKRDARHYAKRQMTWFAHHGDLFWLDA